MFSGIMRQTFPPPQTPMPTPQPPDPALPALRDAVWAIASKGVDGETAARKVAWFNAYLETGDAAGSVTASGFKGTQPARKASALVKQFYPLIAEAVQLHRAALEPLALKVLEGVLQADHMVPLVGKDAHGNAVALGTKVPDAKILGVKVKAADSVLDRGGMPKGLALHGTLQVAGDSERAADWQAHLDELVLRLGVDVVKALPLVRQRPDLRDYVERQYPVKVVEGVMEASTEG